MDRGNFSSHRGDLGRYFFCTGISETGYGGNRACPAVSVPPCTCLSAAFFLESASGNEKEQADTETEKGRKCVGRSWRLPAAFFYGNGSPVIGNFDGQLREFLSCTDAFEDILLKIYRSYVKQ